MQYAPIIKSAKPTKHFQIGKYSAILYGDIERAGPVEYCYILSVVDENKRPCLFVTSEIKPIAGGLGACSHCIGVFDGETHAILEDSDDWGNEVKFTAEALRIVRERLETLKCSYCGRNNSEGSEACRECGTRLMTDSADLDAEPGENKRRTLGERAMVQGIIFFSAGMVVTLFSYFAAVTTPHRSHYIIAYGAILFGIAQIIRGWAAARGIDTSEQAQELLDLAARLESVDTAKALAQYAEIIKNFPGTRASSEAQRNREILTSHKNDTPPNPAPQQISPPF